MSDQEENKQVTVVKNATDLQRLKLEKLMKNPEKLAFIPDKPKEKKFSEAAEFVRNVMGSSAGAGSGEFHVYRHIRRREYARQDFLLKYKDKMELDADYHAKIEENKRIVEERAAKKRAKRQRQKERQKAKRQKLKDAKRKGLPPPQDSSSSEESSEEEDAAKTVPEKRQDKQTGDSCEKLENERGDKDLSSKQQTEEDLKHKSDSGKDDEGAESS